MLSRPRPRLRATFAASTDHVELRNVRQFMDHNYGKHRVFTFAGAKDPSHENAGFRAIPYGYSEEIIRPMDRFNLSPWQVNESMWAESVEFHMPRSPPFVSTASVDMYREGSWEYKAIEEYFMAIQRYGVHAYGLSQDYPLSAYPACVRIFSQVCRPLLALVLGMPPHARWPRVGV
jgi:hypothetical protein